MTKAIEHIVTGYFTLKDRVALEQIRDHRRKLLNETRIFNAGPLRFDSITAELQEELGVVDAALAKL
jgi:hypothetical protein